MHIPSIVKAWLLSNIVSDTIMFHSLDANEIKANEFPGQYEITSQILEKV